MIEKIFIEEGIKEVRMDEYFKSKAGMERAGYSGMDIKKTPMGAQITVYVEKPGMIIGRDGKRIKEVTDEISRKNDFDNPQIEVQAVRKPELSAPLMANKLAKRIERGWHFRKAGRSTLHQIMDTGALGCEITISGKLTGARGRIEKIIRGYIKHCGFAAEEMVEEGYAIAKKKSGVIGVKVWIIKPYTKIPDDFRIKKKEEEIEGVEGGEGK